MSEGKKTKKEPKKREPLWESDSSLKMRIVKGDLWSRDKELEMIFEETREKKRKEE